MSRPFIDPNDTFAQIRTKINQLINNLGDIANVDPSITADSDFIQIINTVISESGADSDALAAIDSDVGNRLSLNTTNKSSIVNAINEVLTSYAAADGVVLTSAGALVDSAEAALSVDITAVDNKIGALGSLTTVDTSSIVAAINELETNHNSLDTRVGPLGSLSAGITNTSIVAAINDVKADLEAADTSLTGSINANASSISTIQTNIGTIGSLATTATNLVGAVNELHGEIGDRATLVTTADANLVAAINETYNRIPEIRASNGTLLN